MWQKLFEAIQDGVTIKINAEITIVPDDNDSNPFFYQCPNCDWSYKYGSTFAMKRGEKAHKKKCKGVKHSKHNVKDGEFGWINALHDGKNSK